MACRLTDDAQGFDDQAPLIWRQIRNKPVFEALGANIDLGQNRPPFLGDREGNGASVAGHAFQQSIVFESRYEWYEVGGVASVGPRDITLSAAGISTDKSQQICLAGF